MSKTREQFISELPLMQSALLIDWLVDMTEKSTNGDRAKEFAVPIISAICNEIRSRKPEAGPLLKRFQGVGNKLRAQKCGDMWDLEAVEKIWHEEGYKICTEILALFQNFKAKP